MNNEEEKFIKYLTKWRGNPLAFVKECIRAIPTKQQIEALNAIGLLVNTKIKIAKKELLTEEEKAVSGKMGVSIMSGHFTGKDALAAWMIIWFLSCFKRPIIPCTAPTADQLQKVLWAEVYKWLFQKDSKGNYICAAQTWLGLQNDKIFMKERNGKDWFAIARTSSANSNPDEQAETLAGFNEDFKMVIIDEATGVPAGVFKPLEGGLAGKCNFILMIFNPTRSRCFAVDSHYGDKARWITFRWNAEECERVAPEHITMMATKYGRASNHYRIRVLGLPPLADTDTLIQWDWIQDAINRPIEPLSDDPICRGIDVGAGGDKSVILTRKGGKVLNLVRNTSKNTMDLVGWVVNEDARDEDAINYVDNVGIGKGVYDRLREVNSSRTYAVDVRRTARLSEKFSRIRDELWWNLRTRFEQGLISIPDDKELCEQLAVIKYKIRESDGKIKVESKDEMRGRGFSSPDEADALCLSFAYSDNIFRKRKEESGRYGRKVETEPLTWMSM